MDSLEKNKFRKFTRIDGNHRLSIFDFPDNFDNLDEEAMESVRAKRETLLRQHGSKLVPYCIVIFDTEERFQRASRALFHNINYKQVPLSMEQNLKLILGSSEVFDDNTLKSNTSSFGMPYYIARKVCDSIDLDIFPKVKQYIGDSKYTYFLDITKELLKLGLISEDEDAISTIKESITEINTALRETNIANITENIAVLGAMTVYKLGKDEVKYQRFVSWVKRNNIGLANKLHIEDVLSIFNAVYDNVPKKVFLARWYPSGTDTELRNANHRLKAIKAVVEGLGLEFVDMGTRTTGTFDIRAVMYS